MDRKTIVCTVALVLGIAGLLRLLFADPIYSSEDDIRNWVLQKVPLGSSSPKVKAFIEQQGWKLDYNWQGINSNPSPRQYPYVRGQHVIGAYLGHYQGIPWRADVDAFWGFDDDEKLIDVHVRKDYDAL